MQIKELDPGNASASKNVLRLTPIVNERREKMKNEMLGVCASTIQLIAVGILLIRAHLFAVSLPLTRLLHANHLLCMMCQHWVLNPLQFVCEAQRHCSKLALCKNGGCAQVLLCCTE